MVRRFGDSSVEIENGTPEPANRMKIRDESVVMQALGLELQCTQNPFLNGVASAVVLRPEELDLVVGPHDPTEEVISEVEHRVVQAVQDANSQFLRVDVRYLEPYRQRQVLELGHGDTVPIASGSASTRKIVILIPVGIRGADAPDAPPGPDDYEASTRLSFDSAGKSVTLNEGEAQMFPAHMVPRVEATLGERVTVHLLYAHGPAFR